MKTQRKFLTLLLGILLTFGLLVSGCPTDVVEDEGDLNDLAAVPVITAQPASGYYEAGGTPPVLSVKAEVTGNGTLSYQWYKVSSFANKGGTPIEGATAATYQPADTAAGTYYYYVVITNTVTDKESAERVSNPSALKVGGSAFVSGKTLTFNPDTEYQYVRGFGGMSNVWTSPDMTVKDIDTLFSPDGLGLNMFRICVYPYMDQLEDGTEAGDPEAGNQRTHGDYYRLVQRVNQYGGYVLASPWTPPAEFKDPPERADGRLKAEFYDDYAQHLRDFCRRMYNKGAPIYAISIQNEPNWEGGYDGCVWTGAEMRDFFKEVGHFTTSPEAIPGYGGGKATPHVLTMNGESANNPNINDAALDDPVSRAAIDLLGRHIYGERTTKYTKGLDMGYEIWMTEINTNSSDAPLFPQDSTWPFVWTFINDVHNCMNNNNESAFIHWYSKRFYGLIGDGQYTTENGVPTYRGWALAQYAKFANETTRIGLTPEGIAINTSTEATSGLKATAYKSEDGNSLSMVILNPTNDAVGDVEIKLPAGFKATGAYGMKTNETNKGAAEPVYLNPAGDSGFISLPASTIISVKFTK
jgi:glucuronoarabinoxylan endo-1,4-beta-xylanase